MGDSKVEVGYKKEEVVILRLSNGCIKKTSQQDQRTSRKTGEKASYFGLICWVSGESINQSIKGDTFLRSMTFDLLCTLVDLSCAFEFIVIVIWIF